MQAYSAAISGVWDRFQSCNCLAQFMHQCMITLQSSSRIMLKPLKNNQKITFHLSAIAYTSSSFSLDEYITNYCDLKSTHIAVLNFSWHQQTALRVRRPTTPEVVELGLKRTCTNVERLRPSVLKGCITSERPCTNCRAVVRQTMHSSFSVHSSIIVVMSYCFMWEISISFDNVYPSSQMCWSVS